MKLLGTLTKALIVLMPWSLKRLFLKKFYGYELSSTARIGLSWIFPERLTMADDCRISHLCVAVNLHKITMNKGSRIGRNNWITGFPKNSDKHFSHIKNRNPELALGAESAITKHHHLDCTESITIGKFTTIAGYHSQLLTHSIDIQCNRQDAAPIEIGDYCFVGSNVCILGGTKLPSFSVLGAKSMLNQRFDDEFSLIAGVPAKWVKKLDKQSEYFNRTKGFVE